MEKPVILIGAGPLTLSIIDIFESNEVVVFGILDDKKEIHGQEIGNIPVLGSTSNAEYLKIIGKQCEAFIAMDENAVKKAYVKILNEKRKVMPVNAIHQQATISTHSSLGHGNLIDMGATLSAGVTLGSHCMVHAGVTLGTGCTLGDYVIIGHGSTIATDAVIEEDVFIGTGSIIVPGIQIGKGARIGAGSVVVENVSKGSTVFGNPAKTVKI